MSCQKEKFILISSTKLMKKVSRLETADVAVHIHYKKFLFFSLGTVDSEIRARGNGYPMRGR